MTQVLQFATAYYAIRRACRQSAEKLGIDPTSVFVLLLVVEHGSPLTTELYALTQVDGAAIRNATYELEAKGMVKRKSADGTPPRPGVAIRITATTEGERIAAVTGELIESYITTTQASAGLAAELEATA